MSQINSTLRNKLRQNKTKTSKNNQKSSVIPCQYEALLAFYHSLIDGSIEVSNRREFCSLDAWCG